MTVASIAPHNLVFGGPSSRSRSWIRTMMQPCASAARLLGGGPILSRGMEAMGSQRVTATSDHLGVHRAEADERRTCASPPLLRLSLSTSFGQLAQTAGRNLAPAGTSPAVT